MKSEIFKMRIDEGELAEWRKKSEAASMSVAAWIRERCNDNSENVPRPPEVPVEGRSVAAPKRKSEFAGEVAGRTGHEVGCGCFQCAQTEGFIRKQRGGK